MHIMNFYFTSTYIYQHTLLLGKTVPRDNFSHLMVYYAALSARQKGTFHLFTMINYESLVFKIFRKSCAIFKASTLCFLTALISQGTVTPESFTFLLTEFLHFKHFKQFKHFLLFSLRHKATNHEKVYRTKCVCFDFVILLFR